MFTEGTGPRSGSTDRPELCDQAIRLARALATLLPGEPEATGLLALLLLVDARRAGRVDEPATSSCSPTGPAQVGQARIDEGAALVERALRAGEPGPYQIQAAIAACHSTAPTADVTDWAQIAALYAKLARHEPTAWSRRTGPSPSPWPRGPPPASPCSTPSPPASRPRAVRSSSRGPLLQAPRPARRRRRRLRAGAGAGAAAHRAGVHRRAAPTAAGGASGTAVGDTAPRRVAAPTSASRPLARYRQAWPFSTGPSRTRSARTPASSSPAAWRALEPVSRVVSTRPR